VIYWHDGISPSPLGMPATSGRTVPDSEYAAISGNGNTMRNSAPVPLCPPQILHDLTWDRTQAPAMGSQRLNELGHGLV
jgi:hypothetical protein